MIQQPDRFFILANRNLELLRALEQKCSVPAQLTTAEADTHTTNTSNIKAEALAV